MTTINAQIRAFAQQIEALTSDPQIKDWATKIFWAAPDSAVEPPTEARISFYEHDNFVGKSLEVGVATPNFAIIGFNDRASSVKAKGRWECYADADYRGARVEIDTGEYPSLRSYGLNDSISSCRPVQPPTPPTPASKRYICSFGGSPDPVCKYVNIRFLPCWGTTEIAQMVDELLRTEALGIKEVVLNVDWLMWSHDGIPVTYLGSTVAMNNLMALFDQAQSLGLLDMVKFVIMPDEPARDSRISESDFRLCALDIMRVASQYTALEGLRLAVIYGQAHDKRLAFDLMHLIGLDDYGNPSGVLQATEEMEQGMGSHQASMTVPNMADFEGKPKVIEESLAYMLSHPRNLMMMVFLYDVAQRGYGFNGTADRVLAVSQQIKLL